MKEKIKKIVASLFFCILVIALIVKCNDILVSKTYNRYYILDKAIEEENESFDVQVFGSCHSYTSFHSPYFEEANGIASFIYANPGEIIPTTYLRMMEQFKKHTPKVALVETWGVNAYETYSEPERVFEYYMPVNVERLPFSFAKMEVINDFYSLDMLLENFAISKYKDRIMNEELSSLDFHYSFDAVISQTSKYSQEEMTMRLNNNGFCIMPLWHDDSAYDPYIEVDDYHELQPDVDKNDTLELEPDMLKYVDKIIELCEKKDVELIFYRAPYLSTENELKKANWISDYLEEKGVIFIDLEKEMVFDLQTDFLDYQHLNDVGAKKATDYLTPYILEAMK